MRKLLVIASLILSPVVLKAATQVYIPSTSTYRNYVINIETGTIRQFTCSTCTMTKAIISSATIGNLTISTANINFPLVVSTLTVTSSFTATNANITNQTVTQSTFTSAVINSGSFIVSAGTSTRLNSTSFVTNTATGTVVRFSSATFNDVTASSISIRNTSNQIIFGGAGAVTTTLTVPTPSQNNVITLPDIGTSGVGTIIVSSNSIGNQTIYGDVSLQGTLDVDVGTIRYKGLVSGTGQVEPDVHYYTQEVFSSRAPGGTGQYISVSTMSFTAGNWDMFGFVCVGVGAATITDFRVAISVNNGVSTADLVAGDNLIIAPNPVTSVNDSCGYVYWYRSITSTTNYYLKAKMNYTSTPTYYGKFWAIRK